MADLTRDEIVIGDMEVNDDCSGVSSYIETCFDVDKKFGNIFKEEKCRSFDGSNQVQIFLHQTSLSK